MRNLLIIIGVISSIFLAGCGGGDDPAPPIQSPPYPEEFSSLYKELSTGLSERENELRADWDGVHTPVIYATALITGGSNNGDNLFDPTFRAGNSLYIQRLADVGIQGIVIQINYPILTANFTPDAPAYLTAFKEIANEIRARGLKVIVEHNVLLPGFSSLDPIAYYTTLSKTQFGQERYLEVVDIINEVNPDYLSLATEPGTYESVLQLQMNVGDWTTYVAGVVNQLSIDVPGYTTKIGAGSGTWEEPSFVTNFASITGLDFIDIHTYPLTNGVTNYLKLLDTWPAMVRTINPSLEIISSESWLYKAQVSELGGSPINSEFLARDAYSFWQPLDSQFFDVLAISAHKNNYSVIAPFWSNYFYAYLEYNDPSLSGRTPASDPTEFMNHAYSAFSQAIQAEDAQTTDLGDHYKTLIMGVGP